MVFLVKEREACCATVQSTVGFGGRPRCVARIGSADRVSKAPRSQVAEPSQCREMVIATTRSL